MLSTDNGGSYRRNRRDIRVVPPKTLTRVTTPSTPSRAISAHNPLIMLNPIRLHLQHLVVMILVKMLHNHKIDKLTMNIMSLNLGAYLNRHLNINRDIDENIVCTLNLI